MYVIIQNDLEALHNNHIENWNSKLSFNKQHDINNVMFSESDNDKRLSWIIDQEKMHEIQFEKCKQWQHDISQLIKEEDKFNTVSTLRFNTFTL